MKAKKLMALAVCLMTVLLLFAFSASAAEYNHCEHGEENYKWITTSQTCNKEGKHERVCTVCNQVVYTEIIPAHNYTVIYTGSVATCTEKGFEAVFCNWCNKVENRETPIDLKNHSYGEWEITTEATCKDEGEKVRYCTRPGCYAAETASVPVDSSKHDAGTNEWETVTPVTCFQEGKEKSLCTVCNQVFTRTVSVHSDYAVNSEKYAVVESCEANCAQPDTVKYQCRDCGISFTIAGERDYDAHDFTDESLWYYSEGADCQHPGTVTKYCKNSRIHKIVEEYAPHVFEGAEIIVEEPKCNSDGSFTAGKKTVKCLYCDEVEIVEVPGTHSFGEWTFLEGDCKTGGRATRTCTCGAVTETESFSAGTHLNYTYDVKNIVYPDCLHDGYMYIYCNDCKTTARLFLEELDSKGAHTDGDWVVTQEATCDKSGLKELHCKMCDEVIKKEVIPQREHSCIILKEGIAADCENAGITDMMYCTLCKAVFEQEIIEASGHNFVEQNTPGEGAVRICDKCYEYEIIGDAGQNITCNCLCHNSNGIAKTIWKFITFFCKLFGMNQECKCGIAHY